MMIIGDDIDSISLSVQVVKAEPLLAKKVRYLLFNENDGRVYIEKHRNEMVLIFNYEP